MAKPDAWMVKGEGTMKIAAGVLVAIVLLAILGSAAFGLEWLGIKWHGFFGPRREAVRREVFKQTRSYNEGKEQELLKRYREYIAADMENKTAILSVVRIGFADYDENLVESGELRVFLRKAKYAN